MNRSVQPEILDELPPDDPEAIRSRGDLRRLNRIMGNAGIIARGISSLPESPKRIVELGAGSGTLLFHALRSLPRPEQGGEIIFLDLVDLISPEVKEQYSTLGWNVCVKTGDVRDTMPDHADLVFANLFLHHFPNEELAGLLARIRNCGSSFFCVEPRRSRTAYTAASLVGLIGCNRVTRHDAAVSVQAGFRDRELSELWGKDETRTIREEWAPPFSHFFLASPNS
ncbi:MAG: class I SAM-dependent methyltransferase [Verrucomicrobiales bacterium]|nr:class I SAM-dependent methyltransferase [Verrucomicrobiales bacterium]